MAPRCLSGENAVSTITDLHYVLCGDDFDQTPVSIKFRENVRKCLCRFCGRCNSGAHDRLASTRRQTSCLWLPRRFSDNHASIYGCGMTKEYTRKKPGEWGYLWWHTLRQECHPISNRSPSNTDVRTTTSGALRRNRVGPPLRPGLRGASRAQVVSIHGGVERHRPELTSAVAVGLIKIIAPVLLDFASSTVHFLSIIFSDSFGCR